MKSNRRWTPHSSLKIEYIDTINNDLIIYIFFNCMNFSGLTNLRYINVHIHSDRILTLSKHELLAFLSNTNTLAFRSLFC